MIATRGNVWSGDQSTLEIFGEFEMSPGTAIRSMLLWQGNTILKAKLKDRTAADSAYEEVVDRRRTQIVPRDPALIESLGGNRYRFKIYPVALARSRKIRILYTVPLRPLIPASLSRSKQRSQREPNLLRHSFLSKSRRADT
ncbi:MAG: hypothetical protein GF344_15855 [Chitinivibrionales bacterium]|nr:hypothetical protein [Chitinivibrionales bacterium]MBD3358170.1 hypothetical protein [Chitinivibrionales bacterium]